jgi:PKD repeat protein
VVVLGNICTYEPTACSLDGSASTDDVGIVSYEWTLDRSPDAFASGAKVDVLYPHGGYRNVTLTVKDTKGQQTSMTYRLQVGFPPGVPPVGSFGYNCIVLTCNFPSVALGNNPIVLNWDFGDGATQGNVTSPSHTYAAPGTYIATMRVVDARGLTHTWASAIEVPYPLDFSPSLTFGTNCPSLSCTFFGNAYGNQPIVVSWNFGDGTTAGNELQPTHAYSAPGTYVVTLTGVDAKGQRRTWAYALKVVTHWPPNPPSASFTSSCSSLSCTLDASGSLSDGGIVSYSWDLNRYPDGTVTGAKVVAVYPHSGTRTVKLTVTDSKGLTSSATQTLTIP